MVEPIETCFPGLRVSAYRVTSPVSRQYNCIAWAAGDPKRWWWPDRDPDNDTVFWPSGVPMNETVEAFVAAFATLGYRVCANEGLEPGIEKVALFAVGVVATHASRQLSNGRWTSKLGLSEDIEHDLHAIAGDVYGAVVRILARPMSAAQPTTASAAPTSKQP